MTDTRDEVQYALGWVLRDLRLHPSAVTLRARVYPIPTAMSDPLSLLRDVVQQILYEVCYTRRLSAAEFDATADPPAPAAVPDIPSLVGAAVGIEPAWDAGWRLLGPSSAAGAYVAKGESVRWAGVGEFAPDPTDGGVWLLVPRQSTAQMPGFFFVIGRTPGDQMEETNLVRFYLHSTASTTVAVASAVIGVLDACQVPFRYKTLASTPLYDRTDASVLYVSARHADFVARRLRDSLGRRHEWLRPAVPLFTARVAHGIGMAVDPGTGASFGMDRCGLVADAIVAAWRAGQTSETERWQTVVARFAAAGLDMARPFLRAGQAPWLAA